MGIYVVYMAMARGAFFFGIIFKVGIHVHFLKASADFQKTYGGHPGTKWRVVYMGYAFSSRDKFQLSHLDRVESCPGMSFIPGSSCRWRFTRRYTGTACRHNAPEWITYVVIPEHAKIKIGFTRGRQGYQRNARSCTYSTTCTRSPSSFIFLFDEQRGKYLVIVWVMAQVTKQHVVGITSMLHKPLSTPTPKCPSSRRNVEGGSPVLKKTKATFLFNSVHL